MQQGRTICKNNRDFFSFRRKQSDVESNELITVDVTASYPEKKLILQDFMDVEYIPLETNDEFLCQGSIWAVGKDILVRVLNLMYPKSSSRS